MRVEISIKIYTDNHVNVNEGDNVSIKTSTGIYSGTIKEIRLKSLSLYLEEGGTCSITYEDILLMV